MAAESITASFHAIYPYYVPTNTTTPGFISGSKFAMQSKKGCGLNEFWKFIRCAWSYSHFRSRLESIAICIMTTREPPRVNNAIGATQTHYSSWRLDLFIQRSFEEIPWQASCKMSSHSYTSLLLCQAYRCFWRCGIQCSTALYQVLG